MWYDRPGVSVGDACAIQLGCAAGRRKPKRQSLFFIAGSTERAWYRGGASAFQAGDKGSNPLARSIFPSAIGAVKLSPRKMKAVAFRKMRQ